MTITDASTNLDTAYTESTTVAFNAGTLASITECVTEVEGKLNRGTLGASSKPTSTQVQTWLIRAKEELAQVKNFSFLRRYASVSTVASQYRYSLPPDYAGGRTVLRDLTNNREIKIWHDTHFDLKYPDPSAETASEPEIACIKGLELWLIPPPNGAYSLEFDYTRQGADNTTTDFSWLPEKERFLCCDFAIAEGFELLHMFTEASYYKNKWASGLGLSVKADAKKRWKSMNYQAISFLDAAYARQNQTGKA